MGSWQGKRTKAACQYWKGKEGKGDGFILLLPDHKIRPATAGQEFFEGREYFEDLQISNLTFGDHPLSFPQSRASQYSHILPNKTRIEASTSYHLKKVIYEKALRQEIKKAA